MTNKQLWFIFWFFLIVTVSLRFYPYLFSSHRLTLTVIWNDAAAECRSQSSMLSGFGRYRSSVPRHPVLGYCGALRTDIGLYLLPDAGRFDWPDQDRSELDTALQPGCRFEVTIVGPGGLQNPERPRVPVVQKISRIHRALGCDQPPA